MTNQTTAPADSAPLSGRRTSADDAARQPGSRPWLLVVLALVLALLQAATALPGMGWRFLRGDNDDLMRLVEVRDLLAGQAWFDPFQHRLLPPEGVFMHWSRYVDAGIAALVLPFSALLGPEAGEMLAVTFWPVLLLCLLILLLGWAIPRLIGEEPPAPPHSPSGDPSAVRFAGLAGALLLALSWNKLGGSEFRPGRIDHHNLQILFCTVVALLLVLPTARPGLFGLLAGAAAAASLSIGLEMLPFLLLIWGLAVLRFAFGLAGAARWLAGFACAIALVAPLLMAGQVAPANWATRWCDVVAPPMLSLLAAGAVATLLPVLLHRQLPHPALRLAAILGLSAAGLAMAWPLLGPCLAGPYAAVPPEAQEIIRSRISEAVPLFTLAGRLPEAFAKAVVPVVTIVIAALLLFWRGRIGARGPERLALIQMLAVVLAGLAIGLVQNRALNIAVPAMPVLAALVAAGLARMGRAGQLRPAVLLALLAGGLVLMPLEPLKAARIGGALLGQPLPVSQPSSDSACRSTAAAAGLDALPPGSLILSPLNLGALILVTSGQSATSAPYHRSNDAFWNGIAPFEDEAAMVKALRKSGADYVALCRTSTPETARVVAAKLLAGDLPVWLSAVPVALPKDAVEEAPAAEGETAEAQEEPAHLEFFRVDHAALAAVP